MILISCPHCAVVLDGTRLKFNMNLAYCPLCKGEIYGDELITQDEEKGEIDLGIPDEDDDDEPGSEDLNTHLNAY